MQIIISPAKTINTKSSQKAPAKSMPLFAVKYSEKVRVEPNSDG